MYCRTIATISLVNTSVTSRSYHLCVCVMRIVRSTLSNFQIYNRVLLTIVTMLYITSP